MSDQGGVPILHPADSNVGLRWSAGSEYQQCEAARAHGDDGCVVDIEDMLNGHCGNLCNEDASERIGYGRVNANHVKIHIKVVLSLYFNTEVINPITEIPSIVDIQQLIYVVLFHCLGLQIHKHPVGACLGNCCFKHK